jgi:hypothetical protein
MSDQQALAEITEHNRVLAENMTLRRDNNDLKAHCLNMLGKLEKLENTIPQVTLDLASTFPLDLARTDSGSKISRKLTHHMGS